MAKTLNAANLEALGAAQLAQLLMEISKGQAAAQRRLRLALAGSAGAAETARAVTKRLASIGQSRTWLDWQKIKPFVAELETQRRAILELVAPSDPREGFELLWRLVGCAPLVFARSDDGGGHLADAFHAAARDLGPLAQRAALEPEELAPRAFRVLAAGGYAAWGELVPILAPALGPAGLELLRDLTRAWLAEPPPPRQVQAATLVLQQIADAMGDVDGYIAQIDAAARRRPSIAAAIARRLLDAERPQEALAALAAAETRQRDQAPMEWETTYLDTLEALARTEEAQAFRWQRFLATLNAAHLRAYLRKLPDFDDAEAEQRALDHAAGFADVHQALLFLTTWPDLRRADALVRGRARALNGDRYELLSTAADALESRYPLAAIVLRRAVIGFTLGGARASRYKHAARHLQECRAAAARVEEFGAVPDQAAYEGSLRSAHGRKAGFWQAVARLA